MVPTQSRPLMQGRPRQRRARGGVARDRRDATRKVTDLIVPASGNISYRKYDIEMWSAMVVRSRPTLPDTDPPFRLSGVQSD